MTCLPSIPGNPPASAGLHPTPTLPPHLCNRCVNTFFLNSFLPPRTLRSPTMVWFFFFLFFSFLFFFFTF